MAQNTTKRLLPCMLVLIAVAGCRASSYNLNFGLAESTDEGFNSAGRMAVDPSRLQRERETDRLAHDLDQDGIPDTRDTDIDGDGIPNYQDTDDDNDGIPDTQDADSNGDGIIDELDR